MTGCDSDIVIQMPKYNPAQKRPCIENISSMFWENKGKNSQRTFFLMAQDSLIFFEFQTAQ